MHLTFKNKIGWGLVIGLISTWIWYVVTNLLVVLESHAAGAHDSEHPNLYGDCTSWTGGVHWDGWTGGPTIILAFGIGLAAFLGVVYLVIDEPKKETLPKAIVVEGNAMVDKCAE